MPALVPQVRVFVASPGDVAAERDAVDRAAEDVRHSLDEAVDVRVLRWERDTYPAMGRPQRLVTEQVGAYDVFVGIMWKRFGTPTGEAGSGTEEEFNRAYERWRETGKPPILFFFREAPFYPRTGTETEQFARVQAFRQRLETSGLVGGYGSVEDFGRKVRRALGRGIRRDVLPAVRDAAAAEPPPEAEKPEHSTEEAIPDAFSPGPPANPEADPIRHCQDTFDFLVAEFIRLSRSEFVERPDIRVRVSRDSNAAARLKVVFEREDGEADYRLTVHSREWIYRIRLTQTLPWMFKPLLVIPSLRNKVVATQRLHRGRPEYDTVTLARDKPVARRTGVGPEGVLDAMLACIFRNGDFDYTKTRRRPDPYVFS